MTSTINITDTLLYKLFKLTKSERDRNACINA